VTTTPRARRPAGHVDGVGGRARGRADGRGRGGADDRAGGDAAGLPDAADWYRDAILYELHVRSFRDGNGDGIGDFPGLLEKLDYLADLGVTALWLLPFYPSPLRDGGYDVADLRGVHPDYGTSADLRRFVREAHRRGLRVVTELVLNHTSDQHPWFERSRRATPGSAWHGVYVWSDTPDGFAGARVLFAESEPSNWTWDPVAGAYYWHRFYAHQPDLNHASGIVRREVLRTIDHWLGLGIDGLRLDGLPYLFEREGTTCENLPETHELVRELRRHVDERFPGRILIAQANQWPKDAAAYFGAGDECQLAFHFPLMPRMYMALQAEDRFPIVDVLEQTPAPPPGAQWALFLRSHDELALEMVTDEERDYLFRSYAADPLARHHVGIRRRLAPLLGNNRRRIELLNALLLALPGTPVLYYGDEIGMGDDLHLGDRDGLRTPMQWTADRNAGFSRAPREALFLPVIVDPAYHYEAVNVAAQQASRNSLLWWTKRIVALRKRHPAFGRGSLELLHPENRHVVAFLRRHGDEILLVVANLSRFAQAVGLDLAAHAGAVPVELFGGSDFPPIGAAPYPLTLGPHGFLWLRLRPPAPAVADAAAGARAALPPLSRVVDAAAPAHRDAVAAALVAWARGRRWFRGKARRVRGAEIADVVPLDLAGLDAALVVLAVRYAQGDGEDYVVPLARLDPTAATQVEAAPDAIVGRLGTDGALLVDALRLPVAAERLAAAIGRRARWRGEGSVVAARPTGAYRALRGDPAERLRAVPLRGEQSNTSVILGDRLILKLYRRLEPGRNPDLEVGRFLTGRGFAFVPAVAGSIEHERPGAEPASVAILQALQPNEGDAWAYTLDALGDFLDAVLTETEAPRPPATSAAALLGLVGVIPPRAIRETAGTYLDRARLLGERTAALHLALASDAADPAFAPEPADDRYRRSVHQAVRSAARQGFDLLGRRLDGLPADARRDAEAALALRSVVDVRLARLLGPGPAGLRIRVHGDYHLGQVLDTGRDFAIIDFEGEPGRPLPERRIKRSPLVDVAGMLRSFSYAASGTLIQRADAGAVRPEDVARLDPWAQAWTAWASAAFLGGYRTVVGAGPILPAADADWAALLDAFLLQKALYELEYEVNNRPAWVGIPLRGIAGLLRR
jgi:maltose alpha-D-glucosyltransferase/alpha-amylase